MEYAAPGVYVEIVPSGASPIAGVGTSTAAIIGVFAHDSNTLQEFKGAGASGKVFDTVTLATPPGVVQLVTNFSEFRRLFGGFIADDPQAPGHPDHTRFAHAVYGFFNNGGTRCYVGWIAPTGETAQPSADDLSAILEQIGRIDEVAIVAAPGLTSSDLQNAVTVFCESLGDRVAVLDGPTGEVTLPQALIPGDDASVLPPTSTFAAYYYPWIQVLDPATNARIFVPPSGHVAGIYARVDNLRGVHKAPANEVVQGAVGVERLLGRRDQVGLNPQGVNCIRAFNGSILVYGARTLGGDANGEFKYISVRRLFNFLAESIEDGTRWTVFEPNGPELWLQIVRNVSAFLRTVWAGGGLFGNTPEQAFFVKCDEETNPPEVRARGQVITQIGVALTTPAEFVIFRLSQWTGPGNP